MGTIYRTVCIGILDSLVEECTPDHLMMVEYAGFARAVMKQCYVLRVGHAHTLRSFRSAALF